MRAVFVFQVIAAVERVALHRVVTGVRNDAAQFGFVGAIAHARGIDDVFLDQDAAHVVGAELQADLANLDSGREPAGLNVVNIVQIEPADGERLEVIGRGRFGNALAEGSIFGREDPGDERGESGGVFLNAADALEVIYAVTILFAAPEHHGRGGAQTERVRGAMHVLPFVGSALEAGDALADFIVEDFGATAGNGAEAGIAEPRDGIAHAEAGNFSDAEHFRRGEAVQVNLRKGPLDRAQ